DDEIGVRLASLVYIVGDYKRAIVKGESFGLSLGAGVGGTSYEIGSTKNTIIDLYLPTVYLDYYATDSMTLFTAPKFIYRVNSDTSVMKNFSEIAVSAGVKYGKETGVIVEGAWAKPFLDGAGNIWQAAVGVFF
ncbi:MAG: hypothetical protein EBX52_14465, partial [Proteobacteria bacterium]|nr:hypothetical protein [Pseudomonadota bacterium]